MRYGHVAEWLRSGLQNRLPRFNSGRGLQHLAKNKSPRQRNVNIKGLSSSVSDSGQPRITHRRGCSGYGGGRYAKGFVGRAVLGRAAGEGARRRAEGGVRLHDQRYRLCVPSFRQQET